MAKLVGEGDKAPDFSLEAFANGEAGGKIALKDYKGKNVVVLYFYPKDDTPGCTTEACDFRDRSKEIAKLGAVVIGVSPDDLKKHGKFVAKHELNFPLLADVEKKVCEAYGVWVEKSMYGRKYMGVERSTFIIGKDGKIAKAWRKVSVTDHGKHVVEALKALK